MSGPESPSAGYIKARIGRDVRVVRRDGADIIGRLANFDGAVLTIEEWWNGHGPTVTTVYAAVVESLWVRG